MSIFNRTFLGVFLIVTVINAFTYPRISVAGLPSVISSKNSERKRQARGSYPSKRPMSNTFTRSPLICCAIDSEKSIEGSVEEVEQLQLVEELNDKEEKERESNLTSSYMVLGVLLITFASNQWSRQALYYLCDFSGNADPFKHINADFNFNKEQYATLASLAFTTVFAIVSLFAGTISDRFDRNKIAALSCGVWSVATALQGMATGYTDLVPLRSIVGASQAFFNPAAYTLIAEIFPKKMIGSINGIFSSGIYLGGALASLSILLDGVIGWRNTLMVIGGIGLITALGCFFFISEPRATANKSLLESENVINKESSKEILMPITTSTTATAESIDNKKEKNNSPLELIKDAFVGLQEVLSSKEAKLLFSASALRFCAGFSIAIWKAPFVFAKFPESAGAFAGSNAIIVALGGLLSSLLGGVLSDYLANPTTSDGLPKRPKARAWVPAIGSLLAAPLWYAFIQAEDTTVAAACLLAEYLTAECWFGPTLASLFNVVPKERRGTAQGLFSLLTALGNFAPIAVGAFAGGNLGSYALGDVLIATVSGAYVLSGFMFLAAAVEDESRIDVEWNKKNIT